MREACKYVNEKLSIKVEKLGKESLTNCAKTSMSSKLNAIDSDFCEFVMFGAHRYHQKIRLLITGNDPSVISVGFLRS
ncbi:hypothetical protein ZIOFF_004258 [Zingiber officinale]|uniref:Uncharacterized protein n=2 Tax=Zingiber officinale TaxID=94328 RepID=A0A8J5INX5_ZINOF|nr:hypothetical protein ZIOFF_004258 [Zingiber officinale]